MYASNYFEEKMLNLMRGSGNNIPGQSNLYLALFMSDPGETGTGGTEISYTGYQRQKITFTAPAADTESGRSIQNSADITFPEAQQATNAVTHIGVFDNQNIGAGNMWLYGELDTPLNVQAGVSPVFRAGNVKWIWRGNITNTWKDNIMNVLRGTSRSSFSAYIACCNGDPTGSGRELSGNGYARIPATFTVPAQQTNDAAMIQNTADIQSGVATGSWGTLNTVAIYTAATGGQAFAVATLGTNYNITTGYAVGKMDRCDDCWRGEIKR